MSEVVGRVVGLACFPVKSMAGEALAAAPLRWHGLDGDRRYAFLRRGDTSRFPWFTARDLSELVRYRARFCDPADPRRSPVEVTAPDGAIFAIDAPELAARLGGAVDLVQLGRGAYDAMPVSVVTTATLAAIDAAHGAPVDPRRFRVNVVVESAGREAAWRGRLIAFGNDGPRLIAHDPIPRCVMVTIDPDGGSRSPALMKTVARDFANEVGIYATPARLGVIRLGDAVRLV